MNDINQTKLESSRNTQTPRFIFVGGAGRSGTSLMQKILCIHSRIAGGPEFDHLVPLMGIYEKMIQPWKLDRQSWYYNQEELDDKIRGFIYSLFDQLKTYFPDADIIAEKTPANIAVAGSLLKLFPNSLFIHVIRDGRDVYASHKTVAKRFKKEHSKKADPWLKDYRLGVVSGRWNANMHQGKCVMEAKEICSRCLTVKYEDLVGNFEKTIEVLCDFLDVGQEPAMLHPEKLQPEQIGWQANIDKVWYTREQFSQSINTNSIGSWKKKLSWWERFEANFRMAPNLLSLGYPVEAKYVVLRKFFDRLRGRK